MMSTESIVMGVCFVVLAFMLLGNIMFPGMTNKQKAIFAGVIFVVIVPLMVLSVMTVNCSVYGGCNGLAGIYAAFTVVFTLVYAGFFVYKVIKHKKKTEEQSVS